MIDDIVAVYFSKDRPMQLDLALKSHASHCEEWGDLQEVVLYSVSDDRFNTTYETLKEEHPNVTFFKQINFKKDLLNLLKNKKYVLFVVDDTIFTQKYSILEVKSALNVFQGILGFSLRLGKNTKMCYPIGRKNDIPYLQTFSNEVCIFNWSSAGAGDFSYPLELSSSMYRIDDIMPILDGCDYQNPNQLESALAYNATYFNDYAFLMCFETSVAFCNPINKVNAGNNNRSGDNPEYSIESLLTKYEKCGRISSKQFDGFVSNGCHQEVDFEISYGDC